MSEFTLSKDADGVATITWDVPGKTMNVMSCDGLSPREAGIAEALADDAVKGVVITSG
jgi:3-hydroxyacyl-CoA dehydrogenase/enoyl-CoA hydratase/3-hydroxybutyryl-CoA epimerase